MNGQKGKRLVLISIVVLILISLLSPTIAIAKTSIKDKDSIDWVKSKVSTFEDVVSRSKEAGIDTSKLEKITSDAKREEAKHRAAEASGKTTEKKASAQEMVKLSHELTDELLSIRKGQNKKDVERALEPLHDGISAGETILRELKSKGEDTTPLERSLLNIKKTVQRVERYYRAKNYELAEEETATAFEEFSTFYSELEPILKKNGITMGD